MRQRSNVLKRGMAMLLAFILCVSGLGWLPPAGMTAKAAGKIEISSARELAQIGTSPEYPMNGDYVLTKDIDLSTYNNGEWIPIGGSGGPEYGLVSGDRVFSGTFDGNGKTISNLKISFDGSSSQNTTNQSGLFAMIGSDSSEHYAEVKNLNFTDVSVSHLLGRGDSIGTLAADVDGYARIDNIAVLSGEIRAASGPGSDLIGVGGVVGQVRTNNSAVRMTNLYNAADVEVAQGLSSNWVRCGGILGRIHQSSHIGALSSCLNVGKITYKGGQGYAVNGYSSSPDSEANTANITACFGLAGTGRFTSAVTQITEAELGSEAVKNALGADYWTISGNRIMPIISEGKVVTPIPMPTFADGDSASSVTKSFTLPLAYESEKGTEAITWSSSNPEIIAIDGADALVKGVIADAQVTLTAQTGSGKTKSITVTVVSNLVLEIDQEYAKPGTSITAAVANYPEDLDISYRWEIDGKTVSQTDAYTPAQSDVNHFITVTASTGNGEKIDDLKFYCSKLPVVYIDTEDGHGITSKDIYKPASMRIQGNDRFNSQNTTMYDGGISIRGRGNSTWNTSFNKLPYKIKLDSKTDLFGFGKSKHWALLANYMDESLVRNTTSYDLSGTMGMNYLKSTHVDVILNGVYAGNYQLVGNVRVESSRVDIYDWEDCAKEAAKYVIKQAKDNTDGAADQLEERLVENLGWITSGTVDYNGNTYDITTCLPKDEEGNVDYSGGFLMELDGYYDEVSKFKTQNNQPIMLKSPEFAYTNDNLFNSVKNYIQAVENSIVAGDFQTEYEQQSCHYSDLVDMDSLVRYFMLNEFFWNTETMKKSTYMYKDLGGKLYIGPIWDMDWTSNSLISASETSNYDRWVTSDRNDSNGHCAQNQQWYKYLLSEPYFAVKVYECYRDNRQNFEDIVRDGGIIDQQAEYLKESADANFRNGFVYHNSADFDSQISRLKTFLKNRLNWLDQQFTSVEKLLSSFDQGLRNSYNSPVTRGFQASDSISVEADTAEKGRTTYTAKVSGSSIEKVGFYINGKLAGTADVTDSTAKLTVEDACLEKESNRYNTVQVRGLDRNGVLLSNGSITNYAIFEKEIEEEEEKGHLIINQVYGGGMNDKTPVSHSFIELYNPTDSAVDLDGYSLGYLSGGENGAAATEQRLSLSGMLPAYTSYLVRCEEQDTSTPELIKYAVKKFDQEWEQTIDNKRFRIVLYKGTEAEDGVSVNEGNIEGAALPDGTISKQKAIRRRNFADTNNNRNDFEVVNYRDEADAAVKKYPRSMADGIWRTDNEPVVTPDPDKKLEGSVSIRGNAIAEAILYADEAVANNTGTLNYQWYADGQEIPGETGMFLVVDKEYEGRKISVSITSTVETGQVDSAATEVVRILAPQTEHMIINQVYGGGGKGDTPVSHSFIELYNSTDRDINLENYRIAYLSKGTVESLDLTGTVPPHTSYLVQCAKEETDKAVCTLSNADIIWDMVISNKSYSVVLFDRETQVDGVSVNEEAVEGIPLEDPSGDTIISKNKSIRRIGFIDTDQNTDDFEVLNYSKLTPPLLERVMPRSMQDGSWGIKDAVVKKEYTVTFSVDGVLTKVTVEEGSLVTPIADPVKEGYQFDGWYSNGRKYDFSAKVNTDLVLTAQWQKKIVEEPKLAAPKVTEVKSLITSKASRVRVKVGKVSGAASYQIYRKKGSSTKLLGETKTGIFYDDNPVTGKVSYLARADSGKTVSGFGASKSITLPKTTSKIAVKALKGKKSVSLKWKRVKGATGYVIYRSTKKNSGYKRIAVIKKGNKIAYTDRKGLKKGKKYYYRIVTAKKKIYSPAKTSKLVKVR